MVDSECLMFASFAKALEDMLKLNKLPHQKASTIAESLAVYKMLLVPNTAYAMSIVHATQKCYYAVEYVSVSWKSFDDLWQGGLCDMVNHTVSKNWASCIILCCKTSISHIFQTIYSRS